MTVLSEKLPAAFEIFAQVLRAPAFREADVERLKAERLAERIQILDEPRGLADESFNRFIYAKESRYSKPMSGNSTSIKSITRDDVHENLRTKPGIRHQSLVSMVLHKLSRTDEYPG